MRKEEGRRDCHRGFQIIMNSIYLKYEVNRLLLAPRKSNINAQAASDQCITILKSLLHLYIHHDILLWGTVGLHCIDNYDTTHTYIQIFINVKSWSYSLTSEVATYLPLFCRRLLSGGDYRIELCCHVVTRPTVSRKT